MGDKLPSNRQVILVFCHNKRIVGLTRDESANLVFDEVKVFWEKARIPTSGKENVRKK